MYKIISIIFHRMELSQFYESTEISAQLKCLNYDFFMYNTYIYTQSGSSRGYEVHLGENIS